MLLSIFGIGGCSEDPGKNNSQAKSYAPGDHNRIYQEACDLIQPYMRLEGAKPRSAESGKARDELNRGIFLLQRVVEINPRNWSAYWVLGKAYQSLNDSSSACDAFGKSFEIQKENPDVAREYMFECLNLGRAEDGIAAARRAVELKPNDSGLLANLALAYLIGGRLDDALSNVDQSLMLEPDDTVTQALKKLALEVQQGKRAQPTSMRDLHGP